MVNNVCCKLIYDKIKGLYVNYVLYFREILDTAGTVSFVLKNFERLFVNFFDLVIYCVGVSINYHYYYKVR